MRKVELSPYYGWMVKLKELKEWQTVVFLTALGLAYRAMHFVVFSEMILPEHDATRYIRLSRNFAAGNFYGVLDYYWPPMYPILLGVVTRFVGDPILPAIIISTIAGGLAVPLTYYFVKQSYGRKPALIAASITIFYPFLINSVFGLGSENEYLLFILGALVVGWAGLVDDSPLDFLFCGILLGAAYLTRPEAIGYPIFFIAFAIGKALWQKRPTIRKTALQVSAIVLGVALLSAPYILYLKTATGTWTISGKASQNFAAGIFDGSEPQEIGEKDGPETHVGKFTPKEVAVNFIYSFRLAQTYIGNLIPMFLLVLVGVGLFGEKWNRQRLLRSLSPYVLHFDCARVRGNLGY